MILKLAFPIAAIACDGNPVNALTFRRPKGADLKALTGVEGHVHTAGMIGRLVSPALTESEIGNLDGFDFLAARDVINGFLLSGPGTTGAADSSPSPSTSSGPQAS